MYPNWLQSNLPREVLQERHLKISFSQNAEDDFIRSYFWDKILNGYKGTYLDVGCFSETLYSNTKLLSLNGWSGLAVDANPDLQEPWMSGRPQDYFLNRCIASSGSKAQGLKFFRFQDGAMSTANEERAKQLIQQGWALVDEIQVEAITLKELAIQATELGIKRPDVASIDLEMVNFLGDLPLFLQILKPSLLCMECISPQINLRNLFSSPEAKQLHESRYEPISLIGGNIFAVPMQSGTSLTVFG